MKIEQVPILLGGFSINPTHLIPVTVAVVVGMILVFGVQREFATFAIVAGVIGAFLVK